MAVRTVAQRVEKQEVEMELAVASADLTAVDAAAQAARYSSRTPYGPPATRYRYCLTSDNKSFGKQRSPRRMGFDCSWCSRRQRPLGSTSQSWLYSDHAARCRFATGTKNKKKALKMPCIVSTRTVRFYPCALYSAWLPNKHPFTATMPPTRPQILCRCPAMRP